MKTLRVILGDQLSLDVAALKDIDRTKDHVLMMEVVGECTSVKHHKQKIMGLSQITLKRGYYGSHAQEPSQHL